MIFNSVSFIIVKCVSKLKVFSDHLSEKLTWSDLSKEIRGKTFDGIVNQFSNFILILLKIDIFSKKNKI